MSETIALFGSTGGTGSHFLTMALEAGYKVNAMVRTPSKLTVTHDNLTVVEGDFDNKEAMEKTVKGSHYVVSMAGGPMGKAKNYPKDLMLNFVTSLVDIVKKTSTVKLFWFQAGAFSATPDGTLPMSMNIFRTMVGSWMMGLKPNFMDNEAVIKYLDGVTKDDANKFKIVVSRPGGLKEAEGGKKLKASEDPEMSMVTFKDLATFTLDSIKSGEYESMVGKYPFVQISKFQNSELRTPSKAQNKSLPWCAFLVKAVAKKVVGTGQEVKEAHDTGGNFLVIHERHKAEKEKKKIQEDIEKTEADIRKAERENKPKDVREKTAELEELKKELAQFQS